MRVLSGIQPSGSLHLGNYFGMMSKMIAYQEESELFCFIANYHAQTSLSDGKVLARGTLEAAANFLALGMNPEKSTFWVQSDLPEVQELTWILSNFTPMGLLERCHSYKDKIGKGIAANHGATFGPGGETFLRFNVGTQRARIDDAVSRLQAAFSDLQLRCL